MDRMRTNKSVDDLLQRPIFIECSAHSQDDL